MTLTSQVTEIFDDSRQMHVQALERLAQGDIRDAAEKAWCATKRATIALILARTGREPTTTTQTSGGLRVLARNDERYRSLRQRYNTCISELHSGCFYDGHCEPEDLISEVIRETAQYIQDAEALAGEE